MFSKRIVPAWLPAACLLLAAGAARAQQPAPQQVPDSVRAMMMEFQQIQQELDRIQQTALEQTPALQQRQEAVREAIQGAMIEQDPALEQKLERLEALPAELQAAQDDQAQMQKLLVEGQRLQQEVQAAQMQAMQREDIAQQVDSFRTALVAKMTELEPKTAELIERMDALVMRLQAASPRG